MIINVPDFTLYYVHTVFTVVLRLLRISVNRDKRLESRFRVLINICINRKKYQHIYESRLFIKEVNKFKKLFLVYSLLEENQLARLKYKFRIGEKTFFQGNSIYNVIRCIIVMS